MAPFTMGKAVEQKRIMPPVGKLTDEIQKLQTRLCRQVGQAIADYAIVIRPLAYVKEPDLAAYAHRREFPIIPCDLCGSQENLQRKAVKLLLREWEQRAPGCSDSMFAALANVAPSLLMDRTLFDFASLCAAGTSEGNGDHASAHDFDEGDALF